MKLSKLERLFISNQFKILEKLYPDEAEYYAISRKAIEEGYTLHYDWIVDHLFDEISYEDCKEVLEILDMYSQLTYSYNRLDDKSGIDTLFLKFRGFDGNNESKYMSYTQYFINDLDRFPELKYEQKRPDFNSHMPTLHKYRPMLNEWNKTDDKFNLSKEDINRILQAS